MNEKDIERIMGRDYSVGTEAFRDNLLSRCLSIISGEDEGMELSDDALDMLAAAGDPTALLNDQDPQ